MAKRYSTVAPIPELQLIGNDLHTIAARLAGIESILRSNVEDPDGNAIFLLAEITEIQNGEICRCADRIIQAHVDATNAAQPA